MHSRQQRLHVQRHRGKWLGSLGTRGRVQGLVVSVLDLRLWEFEQLPQAAETQQGSVKLKFFCPRCCR